MASSTFAHGNEHEIFGMVDIAGVQQAPLKRDHNDNRAARIESWGGCRTFTKRNVALN
jgi:hypothetical protein